MSERDAAFRSPVCWHIALAAITNAVTLAGFVAQGVGLAHGFGWCSARSEPSSMSTQSDVFSAVFDHGI